MDEQEVQKIEAEETPQEQNPEVQAASEQEVPQAVEQVAQPAIQPTENHKERNLRILRERAERAERERDALLRNQQTKQPQQQDEDYSGLPGDDDFAEGKHLKQLKQEIKELKKHVSNSANVAVSARLRAELPDIDKVVSEDNLEVLRETDPEGAAIIDSSQDLYLKAKMAYRLIKSNKIVDMEDNTRERELVKKNLAKPKPIASISPSQGNSPLAKANAFQNDFSDGALQEAWKEMRQILGKE